MLTEVFFIKNVNKTKNYTFKNLRHLINNQDMWIILAGKDSYVVILKGTKKNQ